MATTPSRAPTPKSLILNLLLAAHGAPLSASDAVNSASLFGIRENSVRVALVRLSATGMIQSCGRGAYVLGPQAASMAEDLSRWRHAEERLCEWSGAWLMVSTAGLGRSDRGPLRQRERALALLGFRAVSEQLYLRPDNFAGHAAAARERLHKLGLDAQAPVFVATELDDDLDRRARHLWHGSALSQGYARTRAKLDAWLATSHQLDTETAARESYLLGNDAIRQLVFDPLLPEPLVDVAARQEFHRAVVAFDAAGQGVWRMLLPSLRTASTEPAVPA
ncbi:MAG: PaaX family transcriptional regulator [Proteobacteria bacterium]|uniref:PaaX family transcriptional regulator C-terminal domain-containing protein n=1 Tax=Aquabacterium sp. TaxID=1872578 RepID=UPI0035C78647|nr:PaaX family transcriptional regulator [Pseudomonadota bacterium]